VLERMILPALENGGYAVKTHVPMGQRLGGGAHIVDAIAQRPDEEPIIISLKWQQVSGTAEQKVPFEVMCLEEALKAGKYKRAYVVLGGEGWKLRTFYTSGGLQSYLVLSGLVEIVTLESFVAKANAGRL
jgi:hypothetical protein